MSRFRFGDRLGSGGFGVVRHCERMDGDVVIDGGLAAKFLAEELVDDEAALARFQREVRLLDEELDHVNVMPVLARNLSGTPPWFVMPFAETNLQEVIDGGRAGDRDWIIATFVPILEGMAHAHEREEPVLHRDLKPLNILFVDGVPKIADFGLGKRMEAEDPTITQTWEAMGTQPYMSPEQFADAKRVGPPADVYALGKVLWHMLTGEVPEVLHVDLDAVPKDFRWFIEKCCRRQPTERYANAAEALAAFRLLASSPGMLDPPLEGAEKIVAEWGAAESRGEQMQVVRRLDDHLQRTRDEEELYVKVIPRLPEGLVDLYMDELNDAFVGMLETYDRHISGGLAFSYCDVVADFYRRLWDRAEDLALRGMLLARLINVGASHNRWYVGNVTGDVLTGIEEAGTAMIAAEVIEADPRSAEWFWDPWLKDKALMAPIAEAFDRIREASG